MVPAAAAAAAAAADRWLFFLLLERRMIVNVSGPVNFQTNKYYRRKNIINK